MLPARASFAYDAVPAVTAAALRAQASRIRKMVSGTTKAIIEIGCDLIAVKQSLVEHGHFREWVEAECGLKLRTAENYMRAAQFAEGRNATVALLNPGIVYRLAARSAPPEIVQSVLDRAANGEIVADGEVVAAFRNARFQKREAEREQKKLKRRAESKKSRVLRAAQYAERQRLALQEQDRVRLVVSSIIDTIGEDHVRFLVDTLRKLDASTVIDRLRGEIDKARVERPYAERSDFHQPWQGVSG